MAGNLSNENKEIFGGRHVHPNIVCKNCVYAHGPAPFEDDPEKAYCLVYSRAKTTGKPNEIYFDGEDCEYHTTEAEKKAAEERIKRATKEEA